MKKLHLNLVALMAVAVAASGCLQRDVTETWYIDANGAVTWVVNEQNIRSDSQSPADRRTEEGEFWLAVQQDRHGIAEGLRELRAEKMRTLVLRAESPYTVQTEGRFTGLDILGQRLIASTGMTGSSVVQRRETTWEWTMMLRDPSALDALGDPSSGLQSLLDGIEHLRVVLVAGRFEAAEGFSLSNDRRVATFDLREGRDNDQSQSAITLRLSWTVFADEE